MSEPLDQNQGELASDELEALKARATLMGIQFHPAIGVDKLREKVNAVLESQLNTSEPKPANESEAALRTRKMKEATALIRCKIFCNDPAKREWPGEVITVSNRLVGTQKKYIPYNSDAPYHLPQIILNALREKKVQVFQTKPGKHGIPVRTSKLINAYTIEVLPALTPEELASLARDQSARQSIDND